MNRRVTHISKILLIIFIVLTVFFHLISAIGTGCVAFNIDKYKAFAGLKDYIFLYQFFVVSGIVFSGWLIVNLVMYVRKKSGFKMMLVSLLIGAALALTHVICSYLLRGKYAPAQFRLYINVLALILLLIVTRISKHNRDRSVVGPGTAGLFFGLISFVIGTLLYFVRVWASAGHVYNGTNYINLIYSEIHLVSIVCIAAGSISLIYFFVSVIIVKTNLKVFVRQNSLMKYRERNGRL